MTRDDRVHAFHVFAGRDVGPFGIEGRHFQRNEACLSWFQVNPRSR